MSKHNYSQYSSNKNNKPETVDSVSFKTADAVVTPVSGMPVLDLEAPVVPVVEPVVETVEVSETVMTPATVTGVVANCAKLNVRVTPDVEADVVCVLNAGTELEVDVSKSTNDWFNVYTAAGVEGYCMRKFITAKL